MRRSLAHCHYRPPPRNSLLPPTPEGLPLHLRDLPFFLLLPTQHPVPSRTYTIATMTGTKLALVYALVLLLPPSECGVFDSWESFRDSLWGDLLCQTSPLGWVVCLVSTIIEEVAVKDDQTTDPTLPAARVRREMWKGDDDDEASERRALLTTLQRRRERLVAAVSHKPISAEIETSFLEEVGRKLEETLASLRPVPTAQPRDGAD